MNRKLVLTPHCRNFFLRGQKWYGSGSALYYHLWEQKGKCYQSPAKKKV